MNWLVRGRGSLLGVCGRAGFAVLLALAGVLVWAALAGGAQPYDTYEATVSGDGPVAQYRFDDVSGSSTLADSAGSDTASNGGIPLGGEGPFGGSKSGWFGGEAFASLASDPLAGASAFTAEAWVDWAGGTVYKQPVFEFGSSSTNYLYLTPASALTSHKLLFEIHTTSGGVVQVTATKLAANAWKYLAVTETSTGTVTLYVNGEQVGQTTGATVSPASLGSTPDDYLGKPVVSGEPLFKGSLSNVAFYAKALSAAQVLAHYNAAEFPVNTVAPTITGTPKDGDTLTAHAGSWMGLTPITFGYQWTRCNSAGGECASTPASETRYVLGHEDVGRTLRVAVGASNSAGSASATSAQTGVIAAIKPANTALPAVSGTPKIGQLLTASTGSWSGSPVTAYAYQWQTCNNVGARCTNITGATGSTYRLIPYDVADTIRVTVTATNSGGSASATSELTGIVGFGEPVNVTTPSVSGTARDGQTLTAASGSWAGTEPITYAYQWQSCNASGEGCINITGAAGATLLLGPSNVGSTVRVLVTATNAIGHTSEPSPATAVVAAIPPSNTTPPSVTGTTTDGQTLTASTGTWSGTQPLSYTYQWENCNSSGESCTGISGATNSTYTLTDADAGGTLRTTVTASNSGGSASATSAASNVVLRAPSNTAAPTVSGTARQGQTLTAGTGTWVGPEPISYTYQWESCNSIGEGCLDVAGATASTYTPISGDVGDTLRVTVIASNGVGSTSAVSAASAVVTSGATNCTVTWTGAAGTSWQTSGNWSTGTVPTGSDAVCIPSGAAVHVTSGTSLAGSITGGEASLLLSGGSLELTSTTQTSSIASLSLSHATLKGAGTLNVTSAFTFGPDGAMSGSGSTVVGPGVTGEIFAASGCEPMELSGGRVLVNEGNLTFAWGTLFMSEASRLENKGSFADNSEATCNLTQIRNLRGAASSVSNTGTFQKASGSGTSTVSVAFNNQGSVIAKTGTLAFGGGGIPEEVATGTWAVQGSGVIVLNGGTFLIGEGVDLSAVSIQGATVTREPLAPPSSTSPPSIAGEPFDGQTLSASTGAWGGTPRISYTYQWERCNSSGEACLSVTGATNPTYLLGDGDPGMTIRVLVTAHNSRGSATESSSATAVIARPVAPSNIAPPEISGTTQDGSTLSASNGSWTGTGPISFAYQWQICDSHGAGCTEIPGATESTYVLEHEDVGMTLRVKVEATNIGGSASSTSEASTVVVPLPPANTSLPVIAGTPQDEQTLTAEVGEWEGTPPLTYTYQWLSCDSLGTSCMDIPGATHSTYVLGDGDVGSTMEVMVTATNSVGSASSTSEVSTVIIPPAPTNTVPPVISGAARAGQILSVNTGSWEGEAPITYSYQWQGCNAAGTSCIDIPGATNPTYTPGRGDVGSTLQAIVTATNPGGPTPSDTETTDVIASGAGEAACTDTWVGPREGEWQQGADWSTGSVPGPSDIACASSGVTIRVSSGTNQAGAIYAGSLAIVGGSLELTDTSHASSVAALTLSNATLKGAGSLGISASFTWGAYGAMSGSGSTVVGSTVTGTVEASSGCEPLSLAGRTLINEGTLTFVWGTLFMSEGAHFENAGTFDDHSEASCYTQQIRLPEGEGSAPLGIANTGTFEKTSGSGTGTVAVPFSNEGAVKVSRGQMKFTDGGMSQVAAGSWSTENGGVIVLGGGPFLIGEEIDFSEVRVEGATVTRAPVIAPSSSSPPAISGEPTVGQALSASTGSWNGTLPLHYTYQWQSCNATGEECADITGATSQAYTLAERDTGRTIRARVTATNGGGSATATSAVSTVIVAGAPPTNSALPAVSGTPEDGHTLSATTGSWSGASLITYSYQWERCNSSAAECATIEHANGSRYQLGESDVGSTIRVLVTASNPLGSDNATSTASPVVAAQPPSEIKAPSVSGTPDTNQILQADPGVWAGTATAISYQWERCNSSGAECAPIEGATESEYDLGEGDVATTLRVRIGAGNSLDSLTDTSPVTPVIGAESALANTQTPSISGTPQNGQVLTANQGSWSDAETITYSYQWQTCDLKGSICEAITGATNPTYTLEAANVGHTLRVLVTASDETTSRSEVSSATQPIAATNTPVITAPPAISGTALQGRILTSTTGTWAKEGATVYLYQWERCSQSQSCTMIEGANEPTYTLTENDTGSTILVAVSATDTAGTTTAVSNPTALIGPETIVKFSNPTISGIMQLGGTLTANAGIWSAAGPLTYTYQWETCHSNGPECAPIEGATEPTYTPVQGNIGSTLRVKVTLTSPLGAASAFSAATTPTPNGEVTEGQAQEIAQQTDPSLLAPSTTSSLEEQTVAPGLTDGEEGLSSNSTLTSSSVSKEVPGEFAVNTPEGEISLTPLETSPNATTTPTIVNGAAALFANTWPATDTIVRPDPLGATALLQLRSAEAPTTFSWKVGIGANQELRQLPGGAIAIVDPTEAQPESTTDEGTEEESSEGGEEDGQQSEPPVEEETGEPESGETEEEHQGPFEEEVPLESLPAAPLSSTLPGEGSPGQFQPQDTQARYESATTAVTAAEAQTAGNSLMVIEAPTVMDAAGNTVPASLTATKNTITLTVRPSTGTVYPVLVDPTVAAPSNRASAARAPKYRYGLSDQRPASYTHAGPAPEATESFDKNLKNGPLHIGAARLVIRYDVLTNHALEQREKQEVTEGKKEFTAPERLTNWLHAVEEQHLEPYITLGTNCFIAPHKVCSAPSVTQYEQAIKPLIAHEINSVKHWGAWNEPDLVTGHAVDPLAEKAPRAAQIWEVAQSVVSSHCKACHVVAGEFAEYDRRYIEAYESTILCAPSSTCKRYIPRHDKPAIWGFHDYFDVLHGGNFDSREFVKLADTQRLGHPYIWFSEQGVDLQNGGKATPLSGHEAEQRRAAFTFLNIADHLKHVERLNYYMYDAPTLEEKTKTGNKHLFDSSLLDEKNDAREAYCVLAYSGHKCPPAVTTSPLSATGGASGGGAVCNGSAQVKWKGKLNADGSKTTYSFKYGSTTAANEHSSAVKTLQKGRTVVSVTIAENISTGGAHEGGCAPIYFRLVAKNSGGEKATPASILTFVTDVG